MAHDYMKYNTVLKNRRVLYIPDIKIKKFGLRLNFEEDSEGEFTNWNDIILRNLGDV